MIYADFRWIGQHGIGRFAAHVLSALPVRSLGLTTRPTGPFDPLVLAIKLARTDDATLFFSPGYNAPLFSRVPYVLTIHDLNHIDRPENSSPLKRLHYAVLLKRACFRAACVLTVSEFSKQRIVNWSGLTADRVMNVGNGVDSTFNPNVAPHPSDCPYMLCVGNRKGHKNEHRIVQAFVNARLPLCLLMTGDPTPSLLAQLNSISATSRVRFTGRVTDSQLASLYRGAIALVFPSLYEGFGLPVLEAMACGTPVITSNITALPEIAGDAALLVDPNSTDEITRAIVRIFDDHLLRTTLRERGLRRASLFNWATTILGVHKVLTALQA